MNEHLKSDGFAVTAKTIKGSVAVPLICFFVAMIDGYDTLVLSFIAPLISKEWALAPQSIGYIFASTYAGAAVGATAMGIAADRFGRKSLLLIALTLAGICTFGSARSVDATDLMWWRAIAGIGLGGAIPAISALTAAHAQPARRSTAVARMFLGYPVGALVGGAATAGVMATVGWRGVLIGGGVCACLVVPIVYFFVTERAGQRQNLLNTVHAQHPLRELVSEGRASGTVLVCLATFLTLLVSYFLVSWTPTVLTLAGTSPQRAALGGAVLNLGGLLGAWVLSAVIGRRNPARAIAGCLLAGSVVTALLGQSVAMPGLAAACVVFLVGLLVIGAQANLPALCVHFYPGSVYATGVGLAMAVGRLGSIVGPVVGGRLVSERIGWGALFLLAAVPAAIAAAAIAAMTISRKSR